MVMTIKVESPEIKELVEAIRLTVEYVGIDTLPPLEGWSWYDVMKKYDPELAEAFVEQRKNSEWGKQVSSTERG